MARTEGSGAASLSAMESIVGAGSSVRQTHPRVCAALAAVASVDIALSAGCVARKGNHHAQDLPD